MFSRIRKRITYANVAMTLALVFAMGGGAYAAGKFIITSTKQIKPSVLAQLKGKAGPAGPAGAQGPQGTAGEKGAAGANGKDGAPGANGRDGVSVTGTPIPAGAGEPCGEAGGTAYSTVSGTENVCNGKEGSPGTLHPGETLPSKSTETGTWQARGVDNNKGELRPANISFIIPLASPPEKAVFIKAGASLLTGCKGTVEKPEADPGVLCAFEGETLYHEGGAEGLKFEAFLNFKKGLGPATTGAVIALSTSTPTTVGEEVSAEGTFAVTAK